MQATIAVIRIKNDIPLPDKIVYFDQGPNSESPTLFHSPSSLIVAWQEGELNSAFSAIEEARKSGKWLAGYCSYELGLALEPSLRHRLAIKRNCPLMAFGVFDRPDEASAQALKKANYLKNTTWTNWSAGISEENYQKQFNQVHQLITNGDVYQVNLTFPLHSRLSGDPLDCYFELQQNQTVKHGAFVNLGIGPSVLSRSPELFFSLSSGGELTTRPMKGTSPRSSNFAVDKKNQQFLRKDEKNRAENLMIVDMLRNDLSRIAITNSVKVSKLFDVEAYETVFQMVSEIKARQKTKTSIRSLFEALFPCGSITGAPKINAMKIIQDIEQRNRNTYCGAIGWLAPNSSARFNVAIRTILINQQNEMTLNVGGGVVYDSSAQGEYEEALWKARFASPPR